MSTTASIGDMFNRTEELISWLIEKGVTTASFSRVSEYRELAKAFFDAKDPTSPDGLKLFIQLTDSIYEFIGLLQVKDAFESETSNGFLDRLEKAHKGKTFYIDAKDGESRNFLFELLVASFFAKKGYSITFNDDSDVIATKNENRLYIECKKCYSIKKIEKNLRKAHSQLIQHKTKSDTNTVGIVAIDISHIIREIMPLKEYENNLFAQLAINESFQSIGKQIKKYVYNCNDEFVDTTLATIVHFSVIYWLENVSVFLFSHKQVTTANTIGNTEFAKLNYLLGE